MLIPRRAVVVAATTALALTLVACSGSDGDPGGSGSPAPSSGTLGSTAGAATGSTSGSAAPTSSQPTIASAKQLYVSVGDSYAAGYQPTGRGEGGTTRNGFAYQAVDLARAKGYDLTLVNFGCSGATTTSALGEPGCRARNLGPGAPSYSTPQVSAASSYLRAHRGQVGLITVSLGGNDITACAVKPDTAAVTSCVTSALTTITANITRTVTELRTAAGPQARVVGITYPDIFLGKALSKSADDKNLATLSVFAFRTLINPQLKAAYEKAGASFADVTAATGAYGSLDAMTTLAPYGSVPVPVAKVCTLTYYCQYEDIHPRTNGYKIIAGLVVAALPAR